MRGLFDLAAVMTFALGMAAPVAAQPDTLNDVVPAAIVDRAAAARPVEMATLGWFYENGYGVEADQAKAAGLYQEAAALNDGFAKWRLGVMIDQGLASGSPADAVTLLREAAALKIASAASSLGVMYATGHGVEQDFGAAMRYYQAAARLGDVHGLKGIGVLYANGQGVERDMSEALAHWMVAAAAGNADAKALLIEYMPSDGTRGATPVRARAHQIANVYRQIISEGARTALLSH